MKIGRNSPCPCGSGKKYKHCCGAGNTGGFNSSVEQRVKKADPFDLSRRLAFMGNIGGKRRDFCKRYLRHKTDLFKEISRCQKRHAEKIGKTVQCSKGCVYCCSHFVGGSLQECEAIVYFLYQNETALKAFLAGYPVWRKLVKRKESLFREVSGSFNLMVTSGFSEKVAENHSTLVKRYLDLDIPCPFLDKDKCVIYPARPKGCAAIFTLTPARWCSPKDDNEPVQLSITSSRPEPSFYYGKAGTQYITNIPLMVYEILKGGYFYLCRISGLEGMEAELLKDNKAAKIIRSAKL